MSKEMLIGYILGILVYAVVNTIWTIIASARGTLRIDHTNPEKDLYRFEIDNLEQLSKKKYVRLSIDHNADLHVPRFDDSQN